jgi:hypothetical protein
MKEELVRDFLIKIAKAEDVITYGELCKAQYKDLNYELITDQYKLFESLTSISEYENAQGRPLLSVLVVKETTKVPGGGFFKMASRLKKYNGDEGKDARAAFFKSELEHTYTYWKNRSIRIRE